jgi:hypothetical protein
MKKQICSYDMVAVPSGSYTVTDAEGEMYLCNSRCLCIWAVMLVTKHNLPESERDRSFVVTNPVGKKRSFDKLMDLAQWAAANALGKPESPFLLADLGRRLLDRRIREGLVTCQQTMLPKNGMSRSFESERLCP